jgi:hypothetical protein
VQVVASAALLSLLVMNLIDQITTKPAEVSSPLHAAVPGTISEQQWMEPRFIGPFG